MSFSALNVHAGQATQSEGFIGITTSITKLAIPRLSRFTDFAAVSNDGREVLIRKGHRMGGYRLGMGYALDPEYPERLVFPPESRAWATPQFEVDGIIGCLEGGIGLAALKSPGSREDYAISKTWAVFPIDRRTDPISTNMIRFANNVRLISATLDKARRLHCRVAEDSSTHPLRVDLVDYKFKLRSRETQPVLNATLLNRKRLQRAYSDLSFKSGKRYRRASFRLGWVSASASYAVFHSLRISLLTGAETHFSISGQNHNATMFYLGNDLFRSFASTSWASTRSQPNGSGIWMWTHGAWVPQSDLILITFSANGRFGIFKRLPEKVDDHPDWFLVEFKH